ncbi:MAG TPA: polysaccharide deacetylase family protein [Thermoleophilaceae bacterium]
MPRRPVILAYHGLGEVPREHDPHNMMLPPERFVEQVEGLRRRGYEFLKMADLAARLREPGDLRGVCALTFDDGSLDNHDVLPGLLERLSVPATLFVCPGLLGEPHPFTGPESGVRLMTLEELRAVAAHPLVEIGSHTARHTVLDDAAYDEAYEEMAGSKQTLEAMLDEPVWSFAYPDCGYSRDSPRAAEAAGYTSAVTCAGRGGLRPYELSRESPNRLDTRLLFALKSRGLFQPLYRSAPGRLARAAMRRRRHGRAAGREA